MANENLGGIRGTFVSMFRGATKVAMVIILSAVGISIALFLLVQGYNSFQEYRDRNLAELKTTEIDLPSLKIVAMISWKYENAVMRYRLRITGFPAYLQDPKNLQGGNGFIVNFIDKDGFPISTVTIDLNAMTRYTVGESSVFSGVYYESSLAPSKDEYKKISDVSLAWRLRTELEPKKRQDPEKSRDPEKLSKADPCAPGLSKGERLRRLSAFGTVREVGPLEYTAGGKTLSVLSDGAVLSCD